jgi:hypothetical protein
MPLLTAMFREFQEASKRKPDGLLNVRKIAIVNRLLKDVFCILDAEPSRAYLDLLDEDAVPQNGDVALMLGQTVAAMDAFKEKYFEGPEDEFTDEGGWRIEEKRRGR